MLFSSKKMTIFWDFLENVVQAIRALGADFLHPDVCERSEPSCEMNDDDDDDEANFGSSIRMKLLYVIGGVLT